MPFKYAEKVDSFANEFNKELEENQDWVKLNQNYKPEFVQKRFKEEMTKVSDKYFEKVTSLHTDIESSKKSLLNDKNKKLYPNMMSDDNKSVGEMQRNEARNLLQKENADNEILSEVKTGLGLKRYDFVSTIIEDVSAGMPDKKHPDYYHKEKFYDGITKLRDEHYNNLGLNEINESLTDREKALSKSQRFNSILKKQKLHQSFDNVFLPDEDSEDYSDVMLYHKQMDAMEMSE
jgi:hypothetical protein